MVNSARREGRWFLTSPGTFEPARDNSDAAKPSMEPHITATPSLASQLVAAIVAAAQGVRDAETRTPPLQLTTLKAEITVTFASRLR